MSDRAKRFPAKFPIVIRQGPELFPATICNISMSGGCILGPHALKKGDTVVLDYTVGQTRAFVMWTMAKMAGLRFENELTASGLYCIRDVKASA